MSSETPKPSLDPVKGGRVRKKRVWWQRWSIRMIRMFVVFYLLMGLALYFLQSRMIFPAMDTQGTPGAQVQPRNGEELVEIRAVGGEKIAAIYAPAQDKAGVALADAASRPTLLFFYGNGDCLSRSRGHVDAFRRMGVNVLVPEYIGYGMSEGTASTKGIYDTADASYEYLTNVRKVDPSRVVVVGKSLGGAAAIHVAASRPVGALATFSAFTTLHEVAENLLKFFPVNWLLKHDFDNEKMIHAVHCPVFVAHGTQDDFVPFAMAHRLALAVNTKTCGTPVCVDVKGASHNDLFWIGGDNLTQDFESFLERAMKGPATQP